MGTELHNRRAQAQEELGLIDEKEQAQINRALQKEEDRQRRKAEKRAELENSATYALVKKISEVMDKFCLDPIVGLLPGSIGDLLSSVCVLPFIHMSLFKIKSIPLTLAIIYNTLIDMLLGSIPFFIGDIIDFFNRSYIKNKNLIIGYVEDDREIIHDVNKKAFWMFLGICIVCYLIYLCIHFAIEAYHWVVGLFS